MAVIVTNLACDLQEAVKIQYLKGNLFSADNQANRIDVSVYEGGEPASISGTVTANIIRADGGTVTATGGTISGNVASITMPAAAYAVPGVVSIIVKLTAESVVTTLAAVVANVYQSSTETAIDPGTIIPSVTELIAEIEAAQANIPAGYNVMWTTFAPAFSSSASYTPGQYVTYDGALYVCTTAHTGSWVAGHFAATNVGTGLSDLKSASNDIENCSPVEITSEINITNTAVGNDGAEVTSQYHSASGFIPVKKNDSIVYSNLRAATTANVFSYYSSENASDYISGVPGAGTGTGVSGTIPITADGYIRLCVRADQLSNAYVAIKFRLNDVIDSLQMLNQELVSLISEDGTINTSGGDASNSGYYRSPYIYVHKGWALEYKNLAVANGTQNVISFYTDKGTYSSGIAGQGASKALSGTFVMPSDGYIRIATRQSGIQSVSVKLVPALRNSVVKYVSPTGNDSNDGNTAGTPYATVAKALSENAMDIFLADGTYSETIQILQNCRLHAKNAVISADGTETKVSASKCYVEMEGITVNFPSDASGSYSGIFVKDCIARITNCKVNYAPYMGFRFDGSFAIAEQCVADHAGVDGFNGHDTANNITETLFVNCVATNCGDDGLSFHEEGIIHVIGGEYANNASTGIAPHNNCNCDIRDAYIHHNGRAGIGALVGSYSQGIPDPLPTMVLTGCIFENNVGNAVTAEHYIVKASANGASGNGTDSIVNDGGSTITTFTLM